MYSLNKVQLIGNLTADPEIRQTPNGTHVGNFTVATNRKFTDNAGMQQDQTEFHNVVVWSRLAEISEQYIKKGHKVYIEGRLQTRSWEDQTGAKRYKTEIIVENLMMLTNKNSSDMSAMIPPDPEISSESAAPAPSAKKSVPKKEQEISVEDIPF